MDTQFPFPSHAPAGQAVPASASATPQVDSAQVTVWHAVSVPGHSDAVLQPTHAPSPSQYILAPVPHAVFSALGVTPQVPLVQVAVWHAAGAGQSLAVLHCGGVTHFPDLHSCP